MVQHESGIGAQILIDLGLKDIRVLTNHPKKVVALEGYGIRIADQVPLHIEAAQANAPSPLTMPTITSKHIYSGIQRRCGSSSVSGAAGVSAGFSDVGTAFRKDFAGSEVSFVGDAAFAHPLQLAGLAPAEAPVDLLWRRVSTPWRAARRSNTCAFYQGAFCRCRELRASHQRF